MGLAPLEPSGPCEQPGLGCYPSSPSTPGGRGMERAGRPLESTGSFLPPCFKVLGAQLGMRHVLPHTLAAAVPCLQPPMAGWGLPLREHSALGKRRGQLKITPRPAPAHCGFL